MRSESVQPISRQGVALACASRHPRCACEPRLNTMLLSALGGSYARYTLDAHALPHRYSCTRPNRLISPSQLVGCFQAQSMASETGKAAHFDRAGTSQSCSNGGLGAWSEWCMSVSAELAQIRSVMVKHVFIIPVRCPYPAACRRGVRQHAWCAPLQALASHQASRPAILRSPPEGTSSLLRTPARRPVRGCRGVSTRVSPVELVGCIPTGHMTVAAASCPRATAFLGRRAPGGPPLAGRHSLPRCPGTFARWSPHL